MKTAVLKKNGGFYFEDRPIPCPTEDEALIRVHVCGVCTSDMHAYKEGLGEDYVLGHEVVGTIVSLGNENSGFNVNDRVTGFILEGYAEYTVAKLEDLVKVPDGLSDEAAIIEPMICMLSAVERVLHDDIRNVAVVGTGFMGLALIKLLSTFPALTITAVDIKEELLPAALSMGAHYASLPTKEMKDSFDAVFEFTGAAPGLQMSGGLVKPFGLLAVLGYFPKPIQLDISGWEEKGLEIKFIFENRREKIFEYMKQGLDYAMKGFPTDSLLSHSFPLDKITDAFEMHYAKPRGYRKSYIYMPCIQK